jgi:hypothetical protein
MNDFIDTSKQEKVQKREERKRERDLSDIRLILKSPEGRRFYWRLMSEAGVFHRSFAGDVNTTLFNEGRRSLGIDLLNDLMDAKPTAFNEMQQEYASERKNEERILQEETKASSDPI